MSVFVKYLCVCVRTCGRAYVCVPVRLYAKIDIKSGSNTVLELAHDRFISARFRRTKLWERCKYVCGCMGM